MLTLRSKQGLRRRGSASMERTGAHSGKRWLPGLLVLAATSWLFVIYFHLAVLRATAHNRP